ncbi:MAG: glycosyltransferase, partial [Acidaminococcaceae bacterium]|nr:glycosyltransferase [Acidaminococcaceae bacterium]
MEPIRILHENVIMDLGGIETQLMRIYRNIDRSKVQFDFLVHRAEQGAYDSEIRALGGKIHYAEPFNPFRHAQYITSMKKIFREHPEYKIMLAHSELALHPLKTAKEAGVPVRICYSHNGQLVVDLKRLFIEYEKLFLKTCCTKMFAVSESAARYTYGDKAVNEGKVRIIRNGIIIEDFVFDRQKRTAKRKELGLEGKFIVGHVGRFMKQKNHIFLLEVFKCLSDSEKDAHLLLVGEGRLENSIRQSVKKLGIAEKTTFLGNRMDVPDLMKAMDVFVLPSLWEGFPNVAIEAQASALPIFLSQNITAEAAFSKHAKRLPLALGAESWAKIIRESTRGDNEREDMSRFMSE